MNYTHGHCTGYAVSPTYRSWAALITRCTRPCHRQYKDYGGRGIGVCDRWMGFENFPTNMGERPDGLTIDRYSNKDGDYEPGNCRWATRAEQLRNRRPRTRRKVAQ